MEYKIYKEKEEKKEEKKEPTYLRLIEDGGDIDLIVVDEDGDKLSWSGGHICGIKPNGKLKLYDSLDKDLGFELDDDGQIEIED